MSKQTLWRKHPRWLPAFSPEKPGNLSFFFLGQIQRGLSLDPSLLFISHHSWETNVESTREARGASALEDSSGYWWQLVSCPHHPSVLPFSSPLKNTQGGFRLFL